MKKGCLFFLVLFIAVSVLEWYALQHYRSDLPPFLGIAIALAVVGTVANVFGIYHGFKQKSLLAKPQANWRDGDLVGVSGRLSATRDPLTAPASGRRVAIYEYNVKRITVSGSGKNRSTTTLTDYSGFGMAPCTVQTKRGGIKLVGYPMLANFPTNHLDERSNMERLAEYLSKAKITPKAKGLRGGLKQINEVLKDEDGDVLLDVRDESAVTTPSPTEGATSPSFPESMLDEQEGDESDESVLGGDFRSAFFNASYSIEESVIENGAQVTAFGTYHTNPSRLDVGGILDTFSHSVFPGEGDKVVSKNITKSTIASIIFGAISVVVHYYLFPELVGQVIQPNL